MPVEQIDDEVKVKAEITYHYHERPWWLLGLVRRCHHGVLKGYATHAVIDSVVASLREVGAKVDLTIVG